MKNLLLLFALLATSGCAALNRPKCTTGQTQGGETAAIAAARARPTWSSFDGSRFPFSEWLPARRPARAVVILVPGWDAAMTNYVELARHLARRGYAVYGSEQRTGVYDPVASRRGWPDNSTDWTRDLTAFAHFVASRQPGRPIFLHGHSFGNMVAIDTIAAAAREGRPLARGLVVHSLPMPFIVERKKTAAGTFAKTFLPWVVVPHLKKADPLNEPTGDPHLNCLWLHSAERLQQGYRLAYFFRAGELGERVRAEAKALRLPVLALEGEKDVVVQRQVEDPKAYHRFLKTQLRGGHAALKVYPDGYHAMVHPDSTNPVLNRTRDQALRDITAWLDAHSAR